jgi:hypothetical protein
MLKGKDIHVSFESDARFWFGGCPTRSPRPGGAAGRPGHVATWPRSTSRGRSYWWPIWRASRVRDRSAPPQAAERGAVGTGGLEPGLRHLARNVAKSGGRPGWTSPGPPAAPAIEAERALGRCCPDQIDLAAVRGSPPRVRGSRMTSDSA